MLWKTEWQSLAARIDGFIEAADRFVPNPILHRPGYSTESIKELSRALDPKNIHERFLLPTLRGVYASLAALHASHEHELPAPAVEILSRFLADYREFLNQQLVVDQHNMNVFRSQVALVSAFRAEFEYALRDRDSHLRSLVERGFVHLQRSIAVDSAVRERWQDAFKAKEDVCEKLGAVHLLLHGIWAFKAHSEGERTDLVTQEPLASDELRQVATIAEGLVLTEWKLVRPGDDAPSKLIEAHAQAVQYGKGSLAGFELARHRYLVLVSTDYLHGLAPRVEAGITFLPVNIAVAPQSPSHVSKIVRRLAAL